ncbi:MAG TPA: hypothetical protein VER33_21590, partial [Polyangiaceae bacterium]|nr:hypothetical protein [Polyangiaceae bacterium]
MSPLSPALAVTLLGALASPSAPVPLEALARGSPRPAICRAAPSSSARELWGRARGEQAQRFCEVLARGYAELARTPRAALDRARAARTLRPAEVEPRVLAGRALLRLGEPAQAYGELATSVLAPSRPPGRRGGA